MILSPGLDDRVQDRDHSQDVWLLGHIHISDPRSIRSYEALPFKYDTALITAISSLEQVQSNIT
jgi:hypothetical protein